MLAGDVGIRDVGMWGVGNVDTPGILGNRKIILFHIFIFTIEIS